MRSCWEYHKVYDDFQVKGFRLCLFFRCALVIHNSSDCGTALVLLRVVLNLLFPSYAFCGSSRGGGCVSVLNTSHTTDWLLTSRIVAWCFGQQVCCSQVLCWICRCYRRIYWSTPKNFYWANMDIGNVCVFRHKNLEQRR